MPDSVSLRKTFLALERALSIAQQRHAVIASNISNLDTPKYRSKEIDFKAALAEALQSEPGSRLVRTNPRHIDVPAGDGSRTEPYEEKGEWNGFNWVDIDREMTKLIENTLIYRTATETLMRKIAILKEVIREGGR